MVVVVGEGGCIRSDRGWGGLLLEFCGWWVVVGCGFVEMVNGGLTVRVIRRRESNRKGIEKSIIKKMNNF